MPVSNVTPIRTPMEATALYNVRERLEREIGHALQMLRGERPNLESLSEKQRYELGYQTTSLLARFNPVAVEQAALRAREALATAGFGADYSHLPALSQARINGHVRTVIQAYEIALQGISSPLAPNRSADLSPERRTL